MELAMVRGYQVAYQLGVTPWERAGEAGVHQLASLLDREERERSAPYGKALDLGCGRGMHSVTLARRGWDVTGVDVVPKAVKAARERAAAAGVDVNFLVADVTTLSPSEVGKGFDFFLDVGCLHGLNDEQRQAMAATVSGLAATDATLLLFAFQPGKRGPLPSGADQAHIESVFTGWTLVESDAAETAGMPGPLKKAAPRLFRLRRGSS